MYWAIGKYPRNQEIGHFTEAEAGASRYVAPCSPNPPGLRYEL